MSETSIECREVLEEDYEGIHKAKSAVGMGSKDSIESWRCIYFENPALLTYADHWPKGWVLTRGQEVVGYLGNIPQAYMYKGQILMAALGSGLVVLPEYRGKTRGYTDQLISRYCNQSADFLFNTTANIKAGRLWSSYGFTEVPSTETINVFVRKYNSQHVGEALKRYNLPNCVTSLASPTIAFALEMRKWFKGGRFPGSGQAQRIEHFDERFDKFWSEISRQYDKLLAFRDRKTLKWHFDHFFRTRIIIREDSDHTLTGYAVLVGSQSQNSTVKAYWLADLQTRNPDSALITGLIEDAFQICIEDDVNRLITRGFPESIRKCMTAYHPYVDRAVHGAYLKIPPTSPHKTLLNAEEWFFTPYDGDTVL